MILQLKDKLEVVFKQTCYILSTDISYPYAFCVNFIYHIHSSQFITACSPGEYGVNCEYTCSKQCEIQPCDRFDGACPEGKCTTGFTGDDCMTGQYAPVSLLTWLMN